MKRYFAGKIHGHFSPSFSCFTNTFVLEMPEGSLAVESGIIRTEMAMRLVRYHPLTIPVRSDMETALYIYIYIYIIAMMKKDEWDT
jgi:hypothetical protein